MEIIAGNQQDDNEVNPFTPAIRKAGDWTVGVDIKIMLEDGTVKESFDTEDIKSVRFLEQEDVRGLDMPLWEVDVTLMNIDGEYDIDNPNGKIGTMVDGTLDKGTIAVGMIIYPALSITLNSTSVTYYSTPRAYFVIDHIEYGDDDVTLVGYDYRTIFQQGCRYSGTDLNDDESIVEMLENNIGGYSIKVGKYVRDFDFLYQIPKYPNDEDCKERTMEILRFFSTDGTGFSGQIPVLLPYYLHTSSFFYSNTYYFIVCSPLSGTEIEIDEDRILEYPKKVDMDQYGILSMTATFSDGSTLTVSKTINSDNSNVLSFSTSLFKTISPPSDSSSVTSKMESSLTHIAQCYNLPIYEAEVIDIPDVDIGRAVMLHAKYTTLLGHIIYADTSFDGEIRTRFRFMLENTTDKDPTVTTSTLTAGRISGNSTTYYFTLTEGFHEITINSISLYNILSKSTFTPAYKWTGGRYCPYVSMPTSAKRGGDFSITLSGYFDVGDHTLKIFADEYTDIMFGYLHFSITEASS